MDFIESLIATFCAKKFCDSVATETYTTPAPQVMPKSTRMDTSREQAYLRLIDTYVDEKYNMFDPDNESEDDPSTLITYCRIWLRSVSPTHKPYICQLLRDSNHHPHDIKKRLHLLQELMRIDYTSPPAYNIYFIHNHLLYIIDHFSPITEEDVMIKKMCCFLDGEYYFLEGNYEFALKRLYDVLKWEAIHKNEYFIDGFSGNGLEDLYEAVFINIVNIYALLKMPEKADETRRVFNRLYRQAQNRLAENIKQSAAATWQLPPGYGKYLDDFKKALSASRSFVGYTSVRSESTTPEMFNRFILGVFSGKISYDIHPVFYHEFEIDNSFLKDGEQDLTIEGLGKVFAYMKDLSAQRLAIGALTAEASRMI